MTVRYELNQTLPSAIRSESPQVDGDLLRCPHCRTILRRDMAAAHLVQRHGYRPPGSVFK